MPINSRFGRRQVITVPGSSETSMTGGASGSMRNFLSALKMMKANADAAAIVDANRKTLIDYGFSEDSVNNFSPEALQKAVDEIMVHSAKELADYSKASDLGANISKYIDERTAQADAQLQGFSPSEDDATRKSFAIGDNLVKHGYNTENVLKALTPPPGVSMGQHIHAQQGRTPTRQELGSGYEGSAGGMDTYSPPPDDREMFGDEVLSPVDALLHETNQVFTDKRALGQFMQSDTFKAKLEQAKKEERDMVAADVATTDYKRALAKEEFKSNLIDARSKLELKRKEMIQIAEEGRAVTHEKEKWLRNKSFEISMEQFRNQQATAKEIAKEDRAAESARIDQIKEAEAKTKLIAAYKANRTANPKLSPKDAMLNALSSLPIKDRALIDNETVKLLGNKSAVRLNMINEKTQQTEIVEMQVNDDGTLNESSRKVIGLAPKSFGQVLGDHLTKGAQTKLQIFKFDSEKALITLDKLENLINTESADKLLNMVGNAHFKWLKLKDRMPDFLKALDMDEKELLAQWTQIANTTGLVFTAFRKAITGVAGPVEEFERLENISLSISKLGGVGFRAALSLLKELKTEELALVNKALDAGLLNSEFEQYKYASNLDARLRVKIENLKKIHPDIADAIDDIDAKIASGEIKLTPTGSKVGADELSRPAQEALKIIQKRQRR